MKTLMRAGGLFLGLALLAAGCRESHASQSFDMALPGYSTTVLPVATDFADSLNNTAVTIAGLTTQRRNVYAALRIKTTLGVQRIRVDWLNNIVGTATTFNLQGAYTLDSGAVQLIPAPISAGMSSLTWGFPDGATHTHTLEVWEPAQNIDAAPPVVDGQFVYRVVADSPFTFEPNPTATSRVVILADSIGVGALAAPNTLGWAPRLKATYPGRVSIEGYGGNELYDEVTGGSYGFGSAATLATRVTGLFFGATTKTLIIQLFFNDWNRGHWNKASFTAGVADLCDRVHVIDSTIQIKVLTGTFTGTEASTNGFGETPPQWRTAEATVASGRGSFVTVLDGTTFSLSTAGTCVAADLIHLTTAGQQAVFDGTGACGSSNNMRSVLAY